MNRYITILVLCILSQTVFGQIYTSEVEVQSDANGKVGIGTNALMGRLSIGSQTDLIEDKGITLGKGDASIEFMQSTYASGYAFKLYTEEYGVGGQVNFELAARNGNANWNDIFSIQSNTGNIGIGTTTPVQLLHISSGTSGDGVIRITSDIDNNSEGDNPRIEYEQDGGLIASTVGHYTGLSGIDGNSLVLANSMATNGGIVFATGSISGFSNASEKMRITPEGKVGIGTSSPTYDLDVVGNSGFHGYVRTLDGSDNAYFRTVNANNYSEIMWGDDTNDRFRFYFNYWNGSSQDREVMSLHANGRVGIGTSSPSSELEVAGWYGRSTHGNGGLVGAHNNVGSSSTKSNPIYTIGHSYKPLDASLDNMYGIGYTHTNASFITDPGPNSWGMFVSADGDARIWLAASSGGHTYFNSGGNVGISRTSPSRLDVNGSLRATSITESSDRRLKKNIFHLRSEVERLEEIQSYEYNLKEDNSFHYGLIAQEVEKIFPHMVSTDEEGYMSVAYREFIPLLIEKAKSQDKKIKDLETQNQKLADRLASIEEKLNLKLQ